MRILSPLMLATLFLLSGCNTATLPVPHPFQSVARTPAATPAVIASAGDKRQYDTLVLDNGLRVLLVSDPDVPKAAASLDVFVGSGHEPQDRPGLAHFLEHMLFLGTDKYPQPDEYQAFIAAHGGTHNAYTSYEHTNYFFDIEKSHFPEGLDRFAQFFIAPRFDQAYVEREKHAVDSEYHARIRDESRRQLDVMLQVANPDHPFNRFSIGSLETLADAPGHSVRDDLLAFYRKYYAAPAMALTLVSERPLAEMRDMARQAFAAVPSHPVDRKLADVPLFRPGVLPRRLDVVPEQEVRELTLVFPLPETLSHYRTKPVTYISNILGHEGEGSLLSYLKRQGWADSLGAGDGLDFTNGASLDITIALTETGLRHVDDITMATFQAIRRIRENGLQPWLYDEQARLSDLRFRYMEKTEPDDYAIGLSNNLQHYPAAEVIRGDFLMEHFPEADIRSYLEYLVPDNVLLLVSAKGLPVNAETKWFHVPYAVNAIDPKVVQAWRTASLRDDIRLPAPNEFIPGHLEVRNAALSDQPTRIMDAPGFRAWQLPDARFGVPRGNVRVALYNPAATATPRDTAQLALYADLLTDRLREALYPASLAGVGFAIAPMRQGLMLEVTGFDDKQPEVMDRLVRAVQQADFDDAAFARLKDARQREWVNSNRVMPYRRLMAGMRETLVPGLWPDSELAKALTPVTVADLRQYAGKFLAGISVDMLMHGNYSAEGGQALAARIRTLASSPVERPVQLVRIPAEGSRELKAIPVLHDDSADLLYVLAGDATPRQAALMALTGQLLQSPFFNELRTEKQLGYAVVARPYPTLQVPGMMFLVQSPTHDNRAILSAMQSFLAHAVADVDDATFESHRQALVARYREPANNLQELTGRLWEDLTVYRVSSFDRREQVARMLESVTRDEWAAFARDEVVGPRSRQLLLYSAGKRPVDAAALAREWKATPTRGQSRYNAAD